LGWPKDKKIILFFGLIRKYKGLDLLIEAFSNPPLKDSDVILVIVGEAYESQDKYVQLIQKLNLKERVICDFNYANTEKASRVFCAADVVAQTYISATQSGVTPLAYHYQTPLLVSDIPGLKKPILDDQTGEISEIDPEKIAEHLVSMLDDKTLLGFESAYLKVNNQYSWKAFGKALIDFMSQL
jgi:glycosyltransferase involved in cell wall biosynthesis